MVPFIPNQNKQLEIQTDFGKYIRYPVKTHVIMMGENLLDVLDRYVREYLEDGDMIIMSEKIVAFSQGRAFKTEDIKVSRLAKFLAKFVYKSPYGIGVGMPCTMELCLRDCGRLKVIFAAGCAAVTKLFGIKGVFYRILGPKARAIDGPTSYAIPPYNHYAKMAPDKPDEAAKKLSDHMFYPVVIIDANDLGVEVLGRSSQEISIEFCKQVFKDNPLSQGAQQTPIAIVRPVPE